MFIDVATVLKRQLMHTDPKRKTAIAKTDFALAEHPPYSPDLDPSIYCFEKFFSD